jgi:cell wall assembly regulator SMI1
MDEPPLLSLIQLRRLETLWIEEGAPLVEHLRPGVARGELERLLGPLDVRLPTEARLWWEWHDGVPSGQPRDMGGAAFFFLTLADAVDQYQASRCIATTAAVSDEERLRLWDPCWFPISITGYGGVITCDCSAPDGAPTPIRLIDWGHNEQSNVPVARSFGEMVAWWIDAIERGAWRYDSDLECWELDRGKLANPNLELTRLV